MASFGAPRCRRPEAAAITLWTIIRFNNVAVGRVVPTMGFTSRSLCGLVFACTLVYSDQAVAADDEPASSGVLKSEFIFTEAPFAQCHASTICESGDALVAAWFGGTREGHADVGIWVSRQSGGEPWSAPVQVADGRQSDGATYPCWNPVLFEQDKGKLLLFYKVGPKPDAWWGMLATSDDAGKTWSKGARLRDGILGPIKNKPVLVDGELLCPTSTEDDGWRVHFEITGDGGKTWGKTESVEDPKWLSAIQPAVLQHLDGRLQALCRSKAGSISQTWSKDGGKTWSALEPMELPNPNSGIDAMSLRDSSHVLVYNHVRAIPGKWGGARSPLNVAISEDGKTWNAALVLESEAGEYSYPAVIQTRDGLVHITYTWKRTRIKHVVVDPSKLSMRPIVDGKWPN